MNRNTFLKLLLNISVGTGLSSLLNPVSPISIDKITKEIDKKGKEGDFQIDINDDSTEGGSLKCYYNKGVIQKLEIKQFWESGRVEANIYFQYGQAIKIVENMFHYNVPINVSGFREELTILETNERYLKSESLAFSKENDSKYPMNSDLICKKYQRYIDKCQRVINTLS